MNEGDLILGEGQGSPSLAYTVVWLPNPFRPILDAASLCSLTPLTSHSSSKPFDGPTAYRLKQHLPILAFKAL